MNNNRFEIRFAAVPQNDVFIRNVICCFCMGLNPSVSELSDIKTAVSEAVTNVIVHAYPNCEGDVKVEAIIENNKLHIKISDEGIGIEDVDKALQPFYTTKPDQERSGMGLPIIQAFMENVKIFSEINKGTMVEMTKTIGAE